MKSSPGTATRLSFHNPFFRVVIPLILLLSGLTSAVPELSAQTASGAGPGVTNYVSTVLGSAVSLVCNDSPYRQTAVLTLQSNAVFLVRGTANTNALANRQAGTLLRANPPQPAYYLITLYDPWNGPVYAIGETASSNCVISVEEILTKRP